MWRRGPSQRRAIRAAALFTFVLLVLSACGDIHGLESSELAKPHLLTPSEESVGVAAETRIALVIGNGAYREAPLNNPPNDARLIANTLKKLGFTVISGKSGEPLIDADQKAMKRAIRSFGEQLERVGSDGDRAILLCRSRGPSER